ncbi:MAG: hypothetical protein ACM3ZC_03735 [Bacteroidota bacterium]
MKMTEIGVGIGIGVEVFHGVRILDLETEIWDTWAPLREEYLTE